MDIWISAEVDSNVAEDFRLANNALEESLEDFLKYKEIGQSGRNIEFEKRLDGVFKIRVFGNNITSTSK